MLHRHTKDVRSRLCFAFGFSLLSLVVNVSEKLGSQEFVDRRQPTERTVLSIEVWPEENTVKAAPLQRESS